MYAFIVNDSNNWLYIYIFFQIMDLRNNNLVHVNEIVSEILKNSSTLKELWISGNHIACDCENQPFLSFLQSSFQKVIIHFITTVRCGTSLHS